MSSIHDLPLYESSAVLWTPDDLVCAVRSQRARCASKLIRYARLPDSRHFEDIDSVLEAAKQTFDAISQASGTRVLEHTWGIAALPDYLDALTKERLSSRLLPRGHSLVARVPVIRRWAELSPMDYAPIAKALDTLNLNHPYYWLDDGIDQFTKGHTDPNGIGAAQVYLHDIEPLIAPRLGDQA